MQFLSGNSSLKIRWVVDDPMIGNISFYQTQVTMWLPSYVHLRMEEHELTKIPHSIWNTKWWKQSINPVILSLIYKCQNSLELWKLAAQNVVFTLTCHFLKWMWHLGTFSCYKWILHHNYVWLYQVFMCHSTFLQNASSSTWKQTNKPYLQFIKKNPTRCNNVSNFIIPYLYEAQHVSGDTPPIIRSLKLHWQPLVFHTWKVVGHVDGGWCQAQW